MKNIMISGAASGIAQAYVKMMNYDLFDNIVLVDKANIEFSHPKVLKYKCNIALDGEVHSLFADLYSKNILINFAVNAAGVPGPNKSFESSTVADFDRIMQVNLRGTYLMLDQQIKHMLENKSGKVLNITSVLASCGMCGSSFYSASKAAIVAMSKSLAIEYAEKNITINCLSPGGVDTPLIDDLKQRIGLKTLAGIHPVKRIATPNEIANYMKFIIEQDTSFMTGAELIVDGGYSAQ
jgi:3-oxoacyl-[acyl-carrier protein] reductase